MFETDADNLKALHHPFTRPKDDLENLCKIKLPETLKGAAKAKATKEDGTEEENNTPAQNEQDIGKAKDCLNENLDKNFVKDLSLKLFDWTGERWIISFSQLKGDVSMREKKQKIKRSLIDEAKNSKIYKDVIKNFPDAELTDINLKREYEPND